MKKVTTKMFVALAAVAVTAPFFAMAVLVGLRAVESATGLRENFLLFAFAVAAASAGVLNARGERAEKTEPVGTVAARRSVARKASALHLGW
ncbi:MAG TPA: hypothetical protein VFA21_21045 [Pyrinomonadaceae bacterium]|jgi:hypothetical protein|nr:hypothetical protein [Pyrinomonadaceae bacterium]